MGGIVLLQPKASEEGIDLPCHSLHGVPDLLEAKERESEQQGIYRRECLRDRAE